jgi:hypothetical protein
MYYINPDKQKIKIEINAVTGLQEILLNKERKELSRDETSCATDRVTAYYRIDHPEEQVTYYCNMFCAAIVHPEKKIVLPLGQNLL